MISLLLSLFFLTDSLSQERAAHDGLPADTLREVVVKPDSLMPVERAIRESLKQGKQPHVPTLGEMLEKLSPGINDKMLHPFAVKERKQERRRKRVLKTLENYDRVKTFDELLKEAYQQQMMEDSINALKH